MENVLHKPNPPPTWDLTLIINEGADPLYLLKAYRIIKSYLEPSLIQHKRIKKGEHRFTLTSVGEPIDRSIERTVEGETWPHLKTIGGEYYVAM